MSETLLLEVTGGVAVLTLNQPARRNPMSERMGEELAETLKGVEAREDIRVLVLAITFGSEDLREGLAAARERRPPRFVGR